MQARIIAALVLCVIVMRDSLWAQDETELAKKTQNPVADLISVPLQSNFNFGTGSKQRTVYVHNAVAQRTPSSGDMSVDLLVDLRAHLAFGDSQIKFGLKSEPKLGRDAKVLAQSERGIGCDSAITVYNSADATRWNSDISGESIDADAHWLHELLKKDLSGVDRFEQFLVCHTSSLMIIHNLDVVSVAASPHETNTPLIIDTDAMLTPAVAFQRFQPVTRGNQQVLQGSGAMEVQQLPPRDSLKRPKSGHCHIGKQHLRFLRSEGANHYRLVYYASRNSSSENKATMDIARVNGWTVGRPTRKICDVIWSGNRKPDAKGKLPPVGNTANAGNAIWTNKISDTGEY